MKPLLIGQAPSRSGADAFEGKSGLFLAWLARMEQPEWLARTERINVLEFCWSEVPMAVARENAWNMRDRLRNRRVVLVGITVAQAFDFKPPELLTFYPLPFRCELAVCPHPSGRNRWWNDDSNEERAHEFWCALFEGRPK